MCLTVSGKRATHNTPKDAIQPTGSAEEPHRACGLFPFCLLFWAAQVSTVDTVRHISRKVPYLCLIDRKSANTKVNKRTQKVR